MNHNLCASLNELKIRPLAEESLELLRQWRNSSQNSIFLKKISYISESKQLCWYMKYLMEEDCYYWEIICSENLIGALSIYNIKDKKGEIGRFMIGDINYRGKGLGYRSFLMAMKIGFTNLELEYLQLDVHEKNTAALKIYKKIGFSVVGSHIFNDEGVEYEMTIDRNTYEKYNPESALISIFESEKEI